MLKLRVATAVIMALILVCALTFLSVQGLCLFFTAIVLVAAWEWAAMAGLCSAVARATYALIAALLMLVIAWYCQLFDNRIDPPGARNILGAGCLWWSIALLWVRSFPASAILWGSVFVRSVMGLLTLLPAWLALIFLSFQPSNTALILILVALVASADIGAYFVGRAFGKAKLAPSVSPGKSWAGFWGGLASSCVLAVVIWIWLAVPLALHQVLAITVVTALASVLGDLVESMVKREQGIKDSGVILPGHGGMMDRIDSLTAAAPVFSLCLILAGWH